MLKYLKERKESNDERPFFGYFPFIAPHGHFKHLQSM
jgi:arylsulfatase